MISKNACHKDREQIQMVQMYVTELHKVIFGDSTSLEDCFEGWGKRHSLSGQQLHILEFLQ